MGTSAKKTASSEKSKGQVFTPPFLVTAMLDWCGYQGQDILCKHVTDNSCGDGAFLVKVVDRYIRAALDRHLTLPVIRRQLQRYIHGADNDYDAVNRCRYNLNAVAESYGITGINWRVFYMDSLVCRLFDGMMDYVVGNPPYVRLHNLDGIAVDLVQECSFAHKGNTDLYLAFFELAFRMLKNGGQVCYITPNSWLYSKAGQGFRKHILESNNLLELVDMEHIQLFEGVTTYTLVSRFVKDKRTDDFLYSRFDMDKKVKIPVCRLTMDDILVDGSFYLAAKDSLALLKKIKQTAPNPAITVKNGFATLADRVFINDDIPDSPYTIQVLKASTGQWSRCFFPYTPDGKGVACSELSAYPDLLRYLEANRRVLMKRDIRQGEWWLFGRAQALHSVWTDKLAVNMLVRDVQDLKIRFVPEGQGIHNGYFITASEPGLLQRIEDAVRSSTFIRYVRMLKKYKNGGYYTFSSIDMEQYLHYCFPVKGEGMDGNPSQTDG